MPNHFIEYFSKLLKSMTQYIHIIKWIVLTK